MSEDRIPSRPASRRLGDLAAVFGGGMLGAVARVTTHTAPTGLPWTTLGQNVAGAFVLALLLAGLRRRILLHTRLRLLLGTGLLGAFTTYSTLTVELRVLLATGEMATALAYVALSLGGGLSAALLGLWAGSHVGRPRSPGGSAATTCDPDGNGR